MWRQEPLTSLVAAPPAKITSSAPTTNVDTLVFKFTSACTVPVRRFQTHKPHTGRGSPPSSPSSVLSVTNVLQVMIA